MDHIANGEDIAKVWKKQWSILQGDKVLQRYGMAQEHIQRGEGIAKVWEWQWTICRVLKVLQRYGMK